MGACSRPVDKDRHREVIFTGSDEVEELSAMLIPAFRSVEYAKVGPTAGVIQIEETVQSPVLCNSRSVTI